MTHDVRSIANEFLNRAKDDGMALTNMQLQKLPYLAHGWAYALLGERFICQCVAAWEYGPGYPDLYASLRRYGADAVLEKIHENDESPFLPRGTVFRANLTPTEKLFLDDIWSVYRGHPAYSLLGMVIGDGTPWAVARQHGHATLNEELIKTHYCYLLHKRRAT